jgi:DNA-binding transcriptional ArsR family regulator
LNKQPCECKIKTVRPLFHPSVEDVTVEGILHALSDPVRVAIFTDIASSNCSQNCTNFVNVSERPIPKSTLSQHFKALREAGLIRGERRGVEMQNTSRCIEIDQRFPGLIAAIVKAHNIQLRDKLASSNAGKRKPAKRSARGR